MELLDVVERLSNPAPWSEVDKIPWDDPDFSERMLREHLSQQHDSASRRFETIDLQVAWIHSTVLGGVPTRVLDLGCGPGLYASRLARLGYTCQGIDFSPASIVYAEATSQREGLACSYQHADLRHAGYGSGFGLTMLIFGEFNAFRPADARTILSKAYTALAPGGRLLLEPHTFDIVREIGLAPASWYSSPAGLFSDLPHIVITDNTWREEESVAVTRHYVVDAATGEVTRHGQSLQAYTDEEYRSLLAECGFVNVEMLPSLTGEPVEGEYGLLAIVAEKSE